MKVQAKHGKVTQIMHGASRNYRYVWDVSTSPSLIPARPRVGNDKKHNFCGDMPHNHKRTFK